MKTTLPILALCLAFGGCGGLTPAPTLYQSNSPAGVGTAIFVKDVGLQDTALTFYVRDPKVGATAINIDLVGDQLWHGDPPKAAVWSKDGSVVAVRGADYKAWSHYYDFKNSEATACDIYPLDKRAVCIQNLLQSRGGIGRKVLANWSQFDQLARPVQCTDKLHSYQVR